MFEIGLPRKLCKDKGELVKFINVYNGKKALYRTIYDFEHLNENNKIDYNSAIIDKIFWDFDGEGSWEEANKLHQELNKQKLRHKVNMSGGGYHIFLFCNDYVPINPKSCLYNSQKYFIDELKLKCDMAVVGDIARLYRIENTFNVKRKRFCIPLTESEFNKGDLFCKNWGLKQHFIKHTSLLGGDNMFDLKKFDFKTKEEPTLFINSNVSSSESIVIKELPLCIEELLKRKDLNYKERGLIILYFKEKGYTKKEVLEILKQHLSEKKLRHCVVEEKQLQYLFERDDLIFPKCVSIERDGFCISGCKFMSKYNIYK